MFIEREAIRKKLFLQAVTILHYLVVPSNQLEKCPVLGFYKIQLHIISSFHSTLKPIEMSKNSWHEPNPLVFYYSQPAHSGGPRNDAQGPRAPVAPYRQPRCSCTAAHAEKLREKELAKATSCSPCMTVEGRAVACQRYYTAQDLETQPRDHN